MRISDENRLLLKLALWVAAVLVAFYFALSVVGGSRVMFIVVLAGAAVCLWGSMAVAIGGGTRETRAIVGAIFGIGACCCAFMAGQLSTI